MRRILCMLISVYRYCVSPLLGSSCRFFPTCSAYSQQSISQHGCLKGLALSMKRICRCHPWNHSHSEDPVPQSIAWLDIIRYKRPSSRH